MRGKTLVDKLPQVISDRIASVPVGDTEVANCILYEAIEALTKGLVVDFFLHRQQPRWRGGFREGDFVHSVLLTQPTDALHKSDEFTRFEPLSGFSVPIRSKINVAHGTDLEW